MNEMEARLGAAKSYGDVFTLVKECVYDSIRKRRAGLMLGLSHLGFSPRGFIGAYHQMGANLIVLNADLLKRIINDRPQTLNYHVFHLLMHEYLHSLGFADEYTTRQLSAAIAEDTFGSKSMITKIARDFDRYLPDLRFAPANYRPPESAYVELISDFEKEDTGYIG
ncbi:MAG: hypothetical protein HY518_01190 [Candidatus Aenigmarchaeota archaeon]|nr:hypothetical protein [Candidatus Aenigmarchaeota archaeon]